MSAGNSGLLELSRNRRQPSSSFHRASKFQNWATGFAQPLLSSRSHAACRLPAVRVLVWVSAGLPLPSMVSRFTSLLKRLSLPAAVFS